MKRLLAFSISALFAACQPAPATLEVLPSKLRFHTARDALVLVERASDAKGQGVALGPCTFVSESPEVAEVRPDGTVTAKDSGSTVIHVKCAGLSASVPVQVSLPVRISLDAQCGTRCRLLASDPPTLRLDGVGAEARMQTRVVDAAGEAVPMEVRYEVVDPLDSTGVRPLGVEISQEGALRSQGRSGRYLVLATAGALVAKGLVETTQPRVDVVTAPRAFILAPGEEASIKPQAFQRGPHGLRPIAGATLRFNSSNPRVATVADDGRVKAGVEGLAEIIAAADSGSFAQVRVQVSRGGRVRK